MLVLDVSPLYDNPKVFNDLLVGRSLSFAPCPAGERPRTG